MVRFWNCVAIKAVQDFACKQPIVKNLARTLVLPLR